MTVRASVAALHDFGKQTSPVRHSLCPAAQEEGFVVSWS